jgi:deoxyribose-phosphate aldolase
MDLTSLNNTDGPDNLAKWLDVNLFKNLEKNKEFFPAAICVFPNFTELIRKKLENTKINTAVVTTDFPSG